MPAPFSIRGPPSPIRGPTDRELSHWVAVSRWACESEADLTRLEMEIECEAPNNSLYTFTGNLHLGSQTVALGTNQARPQTLKP